MTRAIYFIGEIVAAFCVLALPFAFLIITGG